MERFQPWPHASVRIGASPRCRLQFLSEPGERREDPGAFVSALVVALLGGISEAIERNNEAVAAAFARRRRARAPGRESSG
jgi:hypothetical protein